jgi:MFS family permease
LSAPAARASSRYAWYVVAVLTLANVAGWIDRQILTLLVVPIRRDLGISLTEMSYLIGLPFAIFYTFMGLPIARLADRSNRRNIIAGGIALWSIMTALCGLAGSYARLLLARIGVGVGEAALAPPAASLLADYFPRERLSTAMSVYSLGIFLGSGLAYVIGGWVVGLVSAQEVWTWPVLGALRPWQTVFIAVGLPGLLIALLMLTVREPARGAAPGPPVSLTELFAYVRHNARSYVTLSGGFALSASVNIGIAAWLATFLIEAHGWTAARAGVVQGTLTMTVGVAGVLLGGRVADEFVRRGFVDGPLRVGVIGSAGMLVAATAYPLVGSPQAAVAWLAVVNLFAAFPWGAASAAAAELVPRPMRAQGVALHFFVVSLVSSALGPWAVAVLAEHVFGRDSALGYALAAVNVIGMGAAILLFTTGMAAYRRTVAQRDSWAGERA